MTTTIKIQPQQIINNQDGTLTTTSRIIAEAFSKNHQHILRDIRKLECSEEFTQSNFGQTPYINKQNGETYNEYQITEKGFMILAMGFTGKKAMTWKEAFINAFENMREQLNKSSIELMQELEQKVKQLDQTSKRLSPEQAGHIQQLVNQYGKKKSMPYQTIYHSIKMSFKVDTYKNILKTDYPKVCAFLDGQPIENTEQLPTIDQEKILVNKQHLISLLKLNKMQKQNLVHFMELEKETESMLGISRIMAEKANNLKTEITNTRAKMHDCITDACFVGGLLQG